MLPKNIPLNRPIAIPGKSADIMAAAGTAAAAPPMAIGKVAAPPAPAAYPVAYPAAYPVAYPVVPVAPPPVTTVWRTEPRGPRRLVREGMKG